MDRLKWFVVFILLWMETNAFGQDPTVTDLSGKLLDEGVSSLARAARQDGDPIRGAILFSQKKLNCVGCHAQGASDRLGPDLTTVAADKPDEHFVESLLLPSKSIREGFESDTILTETGNLLTGRVIAETEAVVVLRDASEPERIIRIATSEISQRKRNTKSTMPDNLASLLTERQEFLDIVKYLMEIAATNKVASVPYATSSEGIRKLSPHIRGLALLDQFACMNCHQAESVFQSAEPGISTKQAPDLRDATARMDPAYLQQFIADPLHVKPGTTMPDLMGEMSTEQRRSAAEAITDYLRSQTNRSFERQVVDSESASRGGEIFHSVGCVACHSPRDDDGIETLLDDSVPLGNLAAKYNVEGLTGFLKDPLSIRPSGRMPDMALTHWEAVDVANYLLDEPASIDRATEITISAQTDPAQVAIGRQHFLELGCVHCHEPKEPRPTGSFPALASARSDRGCLSSESGPWPHYEFDSSQIAAMRAAIEQLDAPLNDRQHVELTMEVLRCYACHQRDGLGGVSEERDQFFRTTNENLGPQGRMPPTLSGVGGKLKPKWLRQVLVSGRTIRPYVRTRMPQYGADNVAHLVDLFQEVDPVPDALTVDVAESKEMRKIGTDLVGSGGLNCIACHTFQQKESQTMPAVDLTEMAQRLHKQWFFEYMRAPQAWSPNTVMPSFWPGGKAIRQDMLEGEVDQQIGVIWNYLLEGRQAPTPRGLRAEPMELLASDDRAVMLRRSYQGIGKRGIGVGYPAGANLAFDAEQMRIGMIWKGKFADPGGVWGGQGHGNVRPLSNELIRFAPGPELDDANSPWLVDEGRPPRHHFMGYFLDPVGRPTFTYRFDDIEIEDNLIDSENDETEEVSLTRTVTFTSTQSRKNLVFRAASGDKIGRQRDQVFLVGDKLRVRIGDGHTARIVDAASGEQLIVPLDVPAGRSTLTIHYTW